MVFPGLIVGEQSSSHVVGVYGSEQWTTFKPLVDSFTNFSLTQTDTDAYKKESIDKKNLGNIHPNCQYYATIKG